jgi:ANTAR domain
MTGDTTADGDRPADDVIVRRSEGGWRVGNDETADLTSAMVLADLFAAELGTATPPAGPPPRSGGASEADEAARLAVTVAQLEHALAARVRVEQAIGVLAERHRLRPRQAFDLLRRVARSGGRRVNEVAEAVVDSAANPLLPLPEGLARRQPPPRKRGRSPRHARLKEGQGPGPG